MTDLPLSEIGDPEALNRLYQTLVELAQGRIDLAQEQSDQIALSGDLPWSDQLYKIAYRLQQHQRRVRQLEKFSTIQSALIQTATEEALLQVVALALDEDTSVCITLSYIECQADGEPNLLSTPIVWQDGTVRPNDPYLYQQLNVHESPLAQVWLKQPEQVVFVTNVATDTRIDRLTQQFLTVIEAQAFALMPLKSRENWQGLLLLFWKESHEFSQDEKFILQGLLEPLSAAVSARRAELSPPVVLAETEVLYLASPEFNRSESLDQVLAVLQRYTITGQAQGVSIHYFNDARPAWVEILSSWFEETKFDLPPSYSLEDYPVFDRILQALTSYLIVDLTTNPSLGTEVARLWNPYVLETEPSTLQTVFLYPLIVGNHMVGYIFAVYAQAFELSEIERRYLNILISQAAITIQSLRNFQQAQTRKVQLERLALIQSRLSHASTEPEIVEAIGQAFVYQTRPNVVLNYFEVDESSRPIAVYAVARWLAEDRQIETYETTQRLSLEQTPLMQFWIDRQDPLTFVSDVEAAGTLDGPIKTALLAEAIRSLALLSFHNADRWLGYIALTWSVPYMFIAEEQQFFKQLWDILARVVVSRRAWLTQQSLREQSQILYETSRLINQANNLEAVLAGLAEGLELSEINRLCLFAFNDNITGEIDAVDILATWLRGQDQVDTRPDWLTFQPILMTLQPYLDSDPIFLTDTSQDERMQPTLDLLQAQDIRALALFPLWVGSLQLGALALISNIPNPFTKEEQELYASVMPQVAVTVDNKRLLSQLQTRATQLEAAFQISQQLSSILSLDELLYNVVIDVQKTFDAYYVQIYLLDHRSQTLVMHEGTGEIGRRLKEQGHQVSLQAEHNIIAQAAYSLEPVTIANVQTYDEYRPLLPETISEIGIPLYSGDTLQGVLNVHHQFPGRFDRDEVRTLLIIANQLSVNLTNILLFDQAQMRATQLETISKVQASLSQSITEHDIVAALGINLALPAKVKISLNYIEASEVPPINASSLETSSKDELSTTMTGMSQSGLLMREVACWSTDANIVGLFKEPLSIRHFPLYRLWIEKPHQILHVADLQQDARVPQQEQTLLGPLGKAFTFVPLRIAGQWQGVIILVWPFVHALTGDEEFILAQLQESLAAVVSSQRANLAQQMALAETEILYQASAYLNLAQSYDDVLTALRRYTLLGQGAQHVSLNYYDRPWTKEQPSEQIYVLARWSQLPAKVFQNRYLISDYPSLVQILSSEDLTVIEDIDQDLRIGGQLRKLYGHRFQAKSTIFMPMIVGGQWIGFINASFQQNTTFSVPQIKRLTALSRQAAVATRVVYQLSQTERRAEREQTIRQITERMRMANTLDDLVQITATELGQQLSAGEVVIDLGIE